MMFSANEGEMMWSKKLRYSSEGINPHDDPYLSLAAAILKQAVEDYICAIQIYDAGQIAKIEKFFLSDYGQALSFGNGEMILNKARSMALAAKEQNCDIPSQIKNKKLRDSTE
jgi:hypothetical protein